MWRMVTVFCVACLVLSPAKVSSRVQAGQTVFELKRRVRIQPIEESEQQFFSLPVSLKVKNTTTVAVQQQQNVEETETADELEQQNEQETEVNGQQQDDEEIEMDNHDAVNEAEDGYQQQQQNVTEVETDNRIVGGRQVSIFEVPWQAALIQDGTFVCGATVVSTIWVLTAAHCVYGAGNSTLIVRAGSDSFRSGGQARRVGFSAVHGQFNRNTLANDVAMLKTTRRFTFGTNIQPARVPPSNALIPNAFFVSGWGSTSAGSASLTRRLRGVELRSVNRRKCQRNYANTEFSIGLNMLCAAAPGRDSCQGDSGGGLLNDGYIYGIVSFGINCADAAFPGVNSNVPFFNAWILNVARLFSRRRNLHFQDPEHERGTNIILA